MTVETRRKLGGSGLFYGAIRVVLYIVYKLLFRFKHFGSENVPGENDSRGVILAPNHESYLDPPLLGISLKRRVTYLAKAYLFDHFFVGFILRSVGGYPIKTESGNDFRSVRDLVRLLKHGHCVVVFPEGTRSETGELREPESGIGFLAMKSGAWVVPTYIKGSYEAMPKRRASASGGKSFKCSPIEIRFGKAFIPAENKEWAAMDDPYTAVAQRIMQDIKDLKASPDVNRQFPSA